MATQSPKTKSKSQTKTTSPKRTRSKPVIKRGGHKLPFGLTGFQLKVIALVFVLAFGVIGAIKLNSSKAATYNLTSTQCYLLGRVRTSGGLCTDTCLSGAGYLNTNASWAYCTNALSTGVSQSYCNNTLRRVFFNGGCTRRWQTTNAFGAYQCMYRSTDTYYVTSTYHYCKGGSTTTTTTTSGWVWPVPSTTSVGSLAWGEWTSSGYHKGIDIGRYDGSTYYDNVVAAHAGTVTQSYTSSSCGGMMVISASGTSYYQGYQHLIPSSVGVSKGQTVKAGQYIGKVGKYGETTCGGSQSGAFYHLHFSIEKGNWLSYYSSPLSNSINPCSLLAAC